jgi:hypothetical protein
MGRLPLNERETARGQENHAMPFDKIDLAFGAIVAALAAPLVILIISIQF